MNKKGFTLIELLAVIVILAIIALIATPIVLNIIEDSKKRAFMQTGNGIIDAAEYYYMNQMSDGVKPVEDKVFIFNESASDLEGLKFDGEVPKEGTLTVDMNGNIRLEAHNDQYCLTKDFKDNEITITKFDGNCELFNAENSVNTLDTICTYDSTSGVAEKTAGARYSCDVDPNKEGYDYNFYVLTTPKEGEDTINLIMDRNICEDGAETTSTNSGIVAWYKSELNSTYGPVTAMNYLYNATKNWTNIEPLNYTYNDKEVQGSINEGVSYISFVSVDGVATITPLTGIAVRIGTISEPLRARMPIYSSDATKTEVADSNGSNEYLYENFDDGIWIASGPQPTNNISGIYGYWTLSSDSFKAAMSVNSVGFVGGTQVDFDDEYANGVRPVITIKL